MTAFETIVVHFCGKYAIKIIFITVSLDHLSY